MKILEFKKNPIDVSQVGIRDGDWSKSNRDVSRTEPRFKKCSKQIGKNSGRCKDNRAGRSFLEANLILIFMVSEPNIFSYNLKSAFLRVEGQRSIPLASFKGIYRADRLPFFCIYIN